MKTKQSHRDVIGEICIRCDYEVVDPWKREKSSIRELDMTGGNQVPAADFIRRGLEVIEKCDVLIVCVSEAFG